MSPPRCLNLTEMAGVMLLITLAAGCSSEPATQSYECHCDYLTDTDGVGVIDVRVCVAESANPVPRAAECAQGQGVGQVNGCKCPGVAEPCIGEVCEQAAARPSAE